MQCSAVDETSRRSYGTHLLKELLEGTEVDGVGVGEGAVDVEQDGLQRRQLRQGAARGFRYRENERGVSA
jgi:hypothetical protein